MRAYRIARQLVQASWDDAEQLKVHPVTERVAGQLYSALGSIASNLGEGYSRSSGPDRARMFEYALGSVRESMVWYQMAQHVLGEAIVVDRLDKLEEIRRMLLAIIPRERGRSIPRSSRPSAEPRQ
jgi:four helix bundle protein